MTAEVIDGKAFAAEVRAQVAEHVAQLKAEHGITPGLAVVLVGEDPASQVYVRSKGKQTVEVGHASRSSTSWMRTRPRPICWRWSTSSTRDPAVHGILVQLPLPKHHELGSRDQFDRSGQGCGRVPYLQRRAAGDRAEVDGALHAAGLPDDAARASRQPVGHGCRGGRALEHRRQADGAAAAGRQLHRDDRAFPDQGSGRAWCAAPISSWRPWAGRRWCRATGSSRAPR